MKSFWRQINEETLAQGDLLPDCLVPQFEPDFGIDGTNEVHEVLTSAANLIIVTQTCDLQNNKVTLVALCPIHTLSEFEEINPKFAQRGKWEEVRKGRVEGLHMLAALDDPTDNRKSLIVDFGQIFSLPFGYLTYRTHQLGVRWRLDSPFLEHFSQAFARYFMRVGLPSTIPSFK